MTVIIIFIIIAPNLSYQVPLWLREMENFYDPIKKGLVFLSWPIEVSGP